jgi:hypothetical protein
VSFFEALMLICFGAAWPASIYKSYTSRTIKGKSLMFMLIVEVGYLSGLTHKLLYSYDNIIYLYALNLIMVGIDLGLYVRNYKLAAPDKSYPAE